MFHGDLTRETVRRGLRSQGVNLQIFHREDGYLGLFRSAGPESALADRTPPQVRGSPSDARVASLLSDLDV